MKKNTVIITSLLILVFLLSGSTIYFGLRFLQMESRNAYHLSELQDIANTDLLNQTIPEGTLIDSISPYLEEISFYSNKSMESKSLTIDVYPQNPPVKSGRQYCGYGLVFDSNRRFKYAICNYPCH